MFTDTWAFISWLPSGWVAEILLTADQKLRHFGSGRLRDKNWQDRPFQLQVFGSCDQFRACGIAYFPYEDVVDVYCLPGCANRFHSLGAAVNSPARLPISFTFLSARGIGSRTLVFLCRLTGEADFICVVIASITAESSWAPDSPGLNSAACSALRARNSHLSLLNTLLFADEYCSMHPHPHHHHVVVFVVLSSSMSKLSSSSFSSIIVVVVMVVWVVCVSSLALRLFLLSPATA